MEIKVTTLTDNLAGYGHLGEWGLSLLVEVDSLKILVDTGTSFTAVHNARLMGIDLAAVDKIVLSHGHADHTGGLHEVLQARRREVDVIAHPDIWAAKYVKRKDAEPLYVGIPHSRAELESRGARFHLSQTLVRLSEHAMTSGEVPMSSGYEGIDSNVVVKVDGRFVPDPLADDLALIIDADFGVVAVLGCAHRGTVNTLRHAQRLTGKERIYAVVGGAHLFRGPAERVQQTVADLRAMGVAKLCMGHCTGFGAAMRLAHEFGEAFTLNSAGNRFSLP